MKPKSIRRDLLKWQIGALLVIALLVSLITFVLTWNAFNHLRDDGLAQIAYSIVRHGLVSSDNEDDDDAADKGQFVSQIWDSDGEAAELALRSGTYALLVLDPLAREVRLDGVAVTLANREFALLEALFENPGAVLTTEQLEDRLYGWGEEIASNAIEVHVHKLRKKLGAGWIRNVRGVGYRLVEAK